MQQNRRPLVLIVDDDPDMRGIVGSVVSLLECDICEAGDGEAALKLYGQASPDVVILDIMMPGMNGTEVCRRIKSAEEGRLVPVIMLTARDRVQDKVDAFDLGADDYLTKPFNYQELQGRIKAHLRIRQLNVDLREKNRQLEAAQAKLVDQERQLAVVQLAATAAHQLGQPLSAIMLNCHLLESLPADDPRSQSALAAIKLDAKRMGELLESLRNADARQKEGYYGDTEILKIKK